MQKKFISNLIAILLICLSISNCKESTGPQTLFLPKDQDTNTPLSLLYKFMEGNPLPKPIFDLDDPAMNTLMDYTRYGRFENAGTDRYKYQIFDAPGLAKAAGKGIYPNTGSIYEDPKYKTLKNNGRLKGNHWDFLNNNDLEAAFYKWRTAPESGGVKLLFLGTILEKAGHIIPALNAYYAALVHFPQHPCWSADGSFVWYIAPAALGSIQRLCRDYPQLGIDFVDANVSIHNGEYKDLTNDIVEINPGRFVRKTLNERKKELPNLKVLKIMEQRGRGKVQLVQYENSHWQMLVDGEPFFIKGVSYSPVEIGLGPRSDPLFSMRWMFSDKNQNGLIDAPYEAWVDQNNNGRQDPDETPAGDFQLMKDMGINAIRLFVVNNPLTKYDPSLINKPLLRDLFARYGIRTIIVDLLGAYTIGSGASWEKGTDYTDHVQRQTMKDVVRAKVMDLKDEPFVLMWVLGNENNLPAEFMGLNATRTNASQYPQAYAQFINEVAKMIHEIDADHPVAIGNLGLRHIEYFREYAPEIDILGTNLYPGKGGFGTLWEEAQKKFDRPVVLMEYGCDAYYQGRGIDEEGQLEYHNGNWRDIVFHQAGGPYTGNALGGIIFEYMDEWWKDTFDNPEDEQNTKGQFPHPFPDNLSHEEWLGIVSQGSGKNSPFERRLRKAYFYYKKLLD